MPQIITFSKATVMYFMQWRWLSLVQLVLVTTCFNRPLLCYISICLLQPSFQPAKMSFYWMDLSVYYSIVWGAGQWVRWATWVVKVLTTWGYGCMPPHPRKFWVLYRSFETILLTVILCGNTDEIKWLLVVSKTKKNHDCSIKVCDWSIRVSQSFAQGINPKVVGLSPPPILSIFTIIKL